METAGRVAVITGAANGIGRALAHEAARRRMTPVLIDQDAEGLARTQGECETMGVAAQARLADVRDRRQLADLAADIDAAASIALVFANAGVLRGGLLASQLADDIDLMIDVNIRGVLNTVAAFSERLAGQAQRSRLVITASQAAFLATPRIGAYSATKHAVWAIAETLAQEYKLADAPVGVTLLCPGAVQTGLVDAPSHSIGGELQDDFKAVMRQRGASPDAIAQLAFEAAIAERFWAFPQQGFKRLVRARLEGLIDEVPPV